MQFFSSSDIMNPIKKKKFEQRILQRRNTIVVLTDAINQIRTVAKGTNIAKIIGNSSSLLGTGAILVGLFLAPLNAGISLLILYIPGFALSFFGSVTAEGASIAYTLKESEYIELAKCALQKDKYAIERHEEIIKDFMTENGAAKQIKQWVTNPENVPRNVTVGAQCSKHFLGSGTLASFANTTSVTDNTAAFNDAVFLFPEIYPAVDIETGKGAATVKTGLRALVETDKVLASSRSTLKRTLPFAIASMTLDMYTIIQTAVDMKTGHTSVACAKLKDMCEMLENELQIMEKPTQPNVIQL